jgi:regulator of sigma E protease
MLLTLILFIVILGLIVLVHEGGHFIFAKLTGVHVYEFSIGMGPVLLKHIAKDKTQYSIRAIPIGGFVSLAGEEIDEKEREKTKGHNLQDKTVFQRFLVMFMGVGNNFIFAFLILLLAALIYGAPSTAPKISDVTAGMPSEQVGIEKGDIVKEINGHKIEFLEDISLYLTISDLSKPVNLTVQKTTGNIEKYTVVPQKVTDDEGNTKYAVGLVLSPEIHKGFIDSIKYAFNEERAIFKQMFVVLGSLFTGGVKVNQLSGPVGILSIVGQTKEFGFAGILSLTALLSVNVGVINLLPFPAFDGGRILFLIIEKIKGSPVDPKVENTIHSIGFILLILLMIYVTFNDILKLF